MNWVYIGIERVAKLRWVIVFLVLFIISLSLINGDIIGVKKLKEITGGVGILDLESSYTPEYAYDILELQGERGREFYRNLLIYQDFIFPVIYTVFWIILIIYLYSKWLNNRKLLASIVIVPLIGGICDLTENILILNMLSAYPEKLYKLAYYSNIFTNIKNISILMSVVLTIISMIVLVSKYIKARIQS